MIEDFFPEKEEDGEKIAPEWAIRANHIQCSLLLKREEVLLLQEGMESNKDARTLFPFSLSLLLLLFLDDIFQAY